MGSDPCRIADVYVPWAWDDGFDAYDDTEWPGPDASVRIIAWLGARTSGHQASLRVSVCVAI